MKAIGVYEYRSAQDPGCFAEVELDKPEPGVRDLLVKVKAISVNPVDYKVRSSIQSPLSAPRILGWDAAGVVEQVGATVSLFQPGDEVYYAGSIKRPGSNAQYQLVDERIVGRKPANLSFAAAAALPLTTITAWEALFEQLGVEPTKLSPYSQPRTVLIINGAGGVGSIAIQLAKQLTGLRVIATASRPESIAWCQRMGADVCIDHHQPLDAQRAGLGIPLVDYVLCFNNTDHYWQPMAEVIKPQGRICSIVENRQPLELGLLKNKSASFSWEFMFTKSMYETENMSSQHQILNRAAELLEQGTLQSTLTEQLDALSPQTLAEAHGQLEAGGMIGKLVLGEIT
jgi:zinc-binding alcohol dehydrogenase family protein